jgi:hypothetical protein
MMLALLLSLVPAITQADGPSPITVKLNHEQFSRGDHARVNVQTAQDGYLVVLHADPDGRVRVLFPLDPTDDAFVRGGKRQELRGRSDRDAFMVDGDEGAGIVLAAVSSDPFAYDGFVLNGHWDYRSLGQGSVKDDPLAGLLDIVRKMSGENPFEYDAATYVVGGRIAARYGYEYGYPSHVRLGVSFGHRFGYPYDPFYDPFCYDPFWSWSARCYGSGFGFGYGYSFYRPYVYGRPYFGGGFADRGGSRFVIPRNRDRFTPVEPRPRGGSEVSPRSRDWGGQPQIAPRERGGRTWSGGRSSGGRPSVSRGGGAVSRPAARPSGGRGNSGVGGGRRH